MTHRTQVITTGPGTFVGLCSCGHITPDKTEFAEAKQEIGLHQINEIRKLRQTPPQPTKRG